MMDLQVVHHHERLSPFTFLFEPPKERQEGVDRVGAGKGFSMNQAVVDAESSNHGY